MGEQQSALRELRSLVRSRHRGGVDRGDLAYRIYATVLFGGFGFYLALGLVDDAPIGPDEIDWVATRAPAWVGLAAAIAIAAGLRSGASGGPLAIDRAELHHLVMSPVDRRVVLRHSVDRLLAAAVGLGVLVGFIVGELAQRRLPGSAGGWIGSAVLVGVVMMAGGAGAALVASGVGVLQRRAWVSTLAAAGIILWSIIDLAQGTGTSPGTAVGRLAVWPLRGPGWRAPVVVGMVVALVLVGRWTIASLSIERAERRAHLIRQVRFALAQQDIRALILLRRQLGFERPRSRPMVRLTPGRWYARNAVVLRGLHNYARWPLQRLVRVGSLAVVGGLALAAMWEGTTGFALAYAVVAYLASLELVEPLAQELDHPSLVGDVPIPAGEVHLVQLGVAAGAMAVWLMAAGGVAVALTASFQLWFLLAVALVPTAAAAVGGAAISTKRVSDGMGSLLMAEEMAGPAAVARLLWPVALAGAGALVVLVGRRAAEAGNPVGPAATLPVVLVTVLGVSMFWWIRIRDDMAERAAAEAEERAAKKAARKR